MNKICLRITLLLATSLSLYTAAGVAQTEDLARYTPEWIRGGYATSGASHEPWFYQIRRNNSSFNLWQRDAYERRLSEDYIKSLADAGITVFHVHFYKGFGFEAEKPSMDEAAEAIRIAHKYGLKADTYIQWNTLAYETFFEEVPEAETDYWYQRDEVGKPIMLTYGFQQSFRFRPCFNHDGYMNYYKEKILRYAVEVADTDFIHFDNFDLNPPPDFCHSPATVRAFREYLSEKYSPDERKERFGFDSLSHVRPPLWNRHNPPGEMTVISDPIMQEWADFRAWTMVSRLAECARFVRELKKEVVIEVNPHGILGDNRVWLRGINHPDLMQYTNVIWTEDQNNPRWDDGVAIGKFRHYKLGRTTGNFIQTYNRTPRDFAENLALNRTIAVLPYQDPEGEAKRHLDFWRDHKDLYNDSVGGEKVAVLRSYPSMAYNSLTTHNAVNMAEQALQQRQIPFDIIFDQQLGDLGKYGVVILANQESLSDEALGKVAEFVRQGGGLVATGDTGVYDRWRRLRQIRGFDEIFDWQEDFEAAKGKVYMYGEGRAAYLPELILPEERPENPRVWKMPVNANQLEAAVRSVSREPLPLDVEASDWIGVSHDIQSEREIIHLFSYRKNPRGEVRLLRRGQFSRARAVSPHRKEPQSLVCEQQGNGVLVRVPEMETYEIVILEK